MDLVILVDLFIGTRLWAYCYVSHIVRLMFCMFIMKKNSKQKN